MYNIFNFNSAIVMKTHGAIDDDHRNVYLCIINKLFYYKCIIIKKRN